MIEAASLILIPAIFPFSLRESGESGESFFESRGSLNRTMSKVENVSNSGSNEKTGREDMV